MDKKHKIEPSPQKEVLFIGVGGASCSGKTTLAKALQSVLPGSVIIHQDDFAPAEQLIPMHPVHNIKDWDDPEGAIDWPRLSAFLRQARADGHLPEDHRSHGGYSDKPENPIPAATINKWRATFTKLQEAKKNENIDVSWGLVDGFLLYWHPDVIRELDIRLFLRVPYETLKARREKRFGYETQEGTFWVDPPGYWDDIVWPAYLKAHRDIFEKGDVNHGNAIAVSEDSRGNDQQPKPNKLPNGTINHNANLEPNYAEGNATVKRPPTSVGCGQPVPGLIVMPSSEITLEELFEASCRNILSRHGYTGDEIVLRKD